MTGSQASNTHDSQQAVARPAIFHKPTHTAYTQGKKATDVRPALWSSMAHPTTTTSITVAY
jgi:hypothetical protein